MLGKGKEEGRGASWIEGRERMGRRDGRYLSQGEWEEEKEGEHNE